MPFWCSKAALWGVVGVTAAAVTTGSLVAAAFVVHYKKESDTAAAVKLIRSSEIIDEKDDKEEEEVDEEEEKDNLELAFRRAFIRRMAREAWDAYCQAAWGQDVVVPGRRRAFNFAFGPCSGHSLVTAMSTLWLLDLKSEFARARRWVVERFTGDSLAAIGKEQWELAPTVADYLGSFLAVYALTGDRVFLEKAVFVARALAPAYETSPTGIPYPSICLKTGVTQKRTSRAAGDSSETSVTS
ncbi:PREDICTED: mannosyl-oligosaccharide alpha-1,2-mannosidase IA-like, partial [Rhagoletis zephyria]|uniref:mannosyl-oligosaccharide alpha-1,2-mannosidase IA-like n=1 Tax=Rhagoletis zephyria TaxID=28612 RepID=UPI000811726D